MVTETNTGRRGGFESDSSAHGQSSGSASDAAGAASGFAHQAGEYANKAAFALASEAQEKAKGLLEQQMEAGAEYVKLVSDSAHSAADELENKAPALARMMHDAADRATDLADQLRQRSANEMFDMAADYARRNPRMFFGGAIAAGFVLSRFLKSSAQASRGDGRRIGAASSSRSSYESRSTSRPQTSTGAASSSTSGSTSPVAPRPASSQGQTGAPATRNTGGPSYAG
jgi:ElaB/YqjD/DUF883 family membrane-anchored ribosome-binding protein